MTLASVPRYDEGVLAATDEHAVVLGGSMAGLLAARVLADRFERVVLVEADTLPDEPVARDGVPQAAQAHVLHEAGRATLEDLFPGFGEDVLSAGGLLVDLASDLDYYGEGGSLASGPERIPMYTATRPLFEHVVRERVRGLEAVAVRDGCRFVDYRGPESGARVDGVRIRNADGEPEDIDAALVVDATGRTSRTPAWLDAHGHETPRVSEIDVDLGYSTVLVERPPDDRGLSLVFPTPPETRGGGYFPVEGDRWMVTLTGVHGDYPPGTVDGLRSFAADLPVPDVAGVLDDHEPVSDVQQYRYGTAVRRRYESLDAFPEGLVVVGDAVASFNPAYGQGMSVAALDALQLHHALADSGVGGLAPRFFDRIERVVDDAWGLAAGADFRFPGATGEKPAGTDLTNWYVARLTRTAHRDGRLADAYLRVVVMEERPVSLFRPSVAWRVLAPWR